MTDDFRNPEIPTNMRDFYVLYWNDRKALNAKLEDILCSQAEDREDIVKFMDENKEWVKNHDKDLATNLKTLITLSEKVDQVEKKVNTWSLTNSLAAIGAWVTALLMKGS